MTENYLDKLKARLPVYSEKYVVPNLPNLNTMFDRYKNVKPSALAKIEAYESFTKKTRDELNKYYEQYEKAYALEKNKQLEQALELYIDNLLKYVPLGSVYYSRPCAILEKLKRYDEAIAIYELHYAAVKTKRVNDDASYVRKQINFLYKMQGKVIIKQ